MDKKEVYDATKKPKFLLDSVDGSAKSCQAKIMPGSDKYEEARCPERKQHNIITNSSI